MRCKCAGVKCVGKVGWFDVFDILYIQPRAGEVCGSSDVDTFGEGVE